MRPGLPENTQTSYKMPAAAEPPDVTALQPKRPPAPVAVVATIMPTEPAPSAPEPPPPPPPAPPPRLGLFRWLKVALFGDGAPAKAPEPEKPARTGRGSERHPRDAHGRGRGDRSRSDRGGRADRPERGEHRDRDARRPQGERDGAAPQRGKERDRQRPPEERRPRPEGEAAREQRPRRDQAAQPPGPRPRRRARKREPTLRHLPLPRQAWKSRKLRDLARLKPERHAPTARALTPWRTSPSRPRRTGWRRRRPAHVGPEGGESSAGTDGFSLQHSDGPSEGNGAARERAPESQYDAPAPMLSVPPSAAGVPPFSGVVVFGRCRGHRPARRSRGIAASALRGRRLGSGVDVTRGTRRQTAQQAAHARARPDRARFRNHPHRRSTGRARPSFPTRAHSRGTAARGRHRPAAAIRSMSDRFSSSMASSRSNRWKSSRCS